MPESSVIEPTTAVGGKVLHPGNSVRKRGLLSVLADLKSTLINTKPQNSSSAFNDFVYMINRCILLIIFFFLAIYKNVLFVYRRISSRISTLTYNPSRTPQLIRDDVNKLGKIPKRVSCILDLKDDEDENGGIDGLINDISELTAWSISAGIPHLSIYEYHGIIADHLPTLSHYISKNLALYFGSDSIPVYSISVPHKNIQSYSNDPNAKTDDVSLHISLLSRADGKPTIVELTKTMSELALNMELMVSDITTELIDEELTALVGPEPDLLISFGPSLDLEDYPPWHIRLSEIYWEPDNMYVNYAVFLRALQKYSNCKVNLGK